MANINIPHHMKDSRWLQLEVCREAQRNKCTRSDEECKFAHPPPHVEIQNGRVVACYDSIKGRCNRDNPPCKYYHPPQHLKDQLLINGRNHLAMKNILVQQMQMQSIALQPQMQMQPQLSLMSPYYNPAFSTGNAYLGSTPAFLASSSSPGPSSSQHETSAASTSMASLTSSFLQQQIQQQQQQIQQQQQQQQQQQHSGGKNRMDRLEVCREFSRGSCRRSEQECKYAHPAEHVQVTDNMVVVCMDSLKGKCGRETCRYFHPPAHLVQQLKSRQSVNTPATDNGASTAVAANAALGLNVYAPSTASVAVPVSMAFPAVSVPVNMAATASGMGSNSEYEQALQAAMAAQQAVTSPFLAAAAMLNQKQAMAALMAAAAQQVQAQMQAAASSVYAHSSAVNNAAAAAQAAAAAGYTPSLNALAAAGWSDLMSQGQKGLKRKASYEQDNELVFHGLAASVKRQTMSPSPLSNPSLALYQQQQQQSLQAMYGIGPLLSSFQHSLSMQHYPTLHHSSLTGIGLAGISPSGSGIVELGQPESSQEQESPNDDPSSSNS